MEKKGRESVQKSKVYSRTEKILCLMSHLVNFTDQLYTAQFKQILIMTYSKQSLPKMTKYLH